VEVRLQRVPIPPPFKIFFLKWLGSLFQINRYTSNMLVSIVFVIILVRIQSVVLKSLFLVTAF